MLWSCRPVNNNYGVLWAHAAPATPAAFLLLPVLLRSPHSDVHTIVCAWGGGGGGGRGGGGGGGGGVLVCVCVCQYVCVCVWNVWTCSFCYYVFALATPLLSSGDITWLSHPRKKCDRLATPGRSQCSVVGSFTASHPRKQVSGGSFTH